MSGLDRFRCRFHLRRSRVLDQGGHLLGLIRTLLRRRLRCNASLPLLADSVDRVPHGAESLGISRLEPFLNRRDLRMLGRRWVAFWIGQWSLIRSTFAGDMNPVRRLD